MIYIITTRRLINLPRRRMLSGPARKLENQLNSPAPQSKGWKQVLPWLIIRSAFCGAAHDPFLKPLVEC